MMIDLSPLTRYDTEIKSRKHRIAWLMWEYPQLSKKAAAKIIDDFLTPAWQKPGFIFPTVIMLAFVVWSFYIAFTKEV